MSRNTMFVTSRRVSRTEQITEAIGKVFGATVAVFIVGAILASLRGWGFMILIGIAHASDPVIPAFGFWASFALALAIQVAAFQYTASKD